MRLICSIAVAMTVMIGGCAERLTNTPAEGSSSLDNTAESRRVTILVMLPAYNAAEQIRRGNMGHAAIEVDGRLYDMGSLNGYAYPFQSTRAVRFWNFPTANAALQSISEQTDCDGHRDRIVRFDVDVTPVQVDRLRAWWTKMDRRMTADDNRFYLWSDFQCASSVSRSLRHAGITPGSVQTPAQLADQLSTKLSHTAGPRAGKSAPATLVQPGHPGSSTSTTLTLVSRFPKLFSAGRRSRLLIPSPDDGSLQPLAWSDSPEYAKQTATFRLRPADAMRVALSDPRSYGAQPTPNFIIGRWYHIATDHIIGQAALAGLYVHANTGALLHSTDNRVIRFDSFDGDRLVPGAAGKDTRTASVVP